MTRKDLPRKATGERTTTTATGHRCTFPCTLIPLRIRPGIGPGLENGWATWAEGKAADEHHKAEIAAIRLNPGYYHPWFELFDDDRDKVTQPADGRRFPRAFDPAAAGGQPHRQGVEPTPVHPDDPPTGAPGSRPA
jgi:hypothetical protein